jgi:hypothetical protein
LASFTHQSRSFRICRGQDFQPAEIVDARWIDGYG